MANELTDADLIYTLQVIVGKSRAEAAAELGIKGTMLRERIRVAKLRGLHADMVLKDPLQVERQKRKRAEAALAAVVRHNESAEEIRRVIYDLAENTPEPPEWIRDARFSGTPGCPMTMWSDWHYGEVVNPSEVGGVNKFDSAIAVKRIEKLVDRTCRLVNGFAFKEGSKKAEFPGIVVCLGGDMISGDIHEELAETNDRKPLECIHELTDILIAALTRMADEFGKVFVPCVVGNHGRVTKKPRAKGRIITSYEWNLYCQLERWFRNDERVSIYVPSETDAYFSVLGHRFLLTHGDTMGVRGGDGIIGALGPIMRGRVKVGASESHIGRDFDTMVIGHWHQELWLPGCIVNNSLKGYDEYARLYLRAPFSRPSQNLWFVHEQQGITSRLSVFVDDTPKAKKRKRDFVTVFK